MLAVKTECLLRARGAHGSTVFAKNLRDRSASYCVLARRIISIRSRHFAACLLKNLWHSRPRLRRCLLLLLPRWFRPPSAGSLCPPRRTRARDRRSNHLSYTATEQMTWDFGREGA